MTAPVGIVDAHHHVWDLTEHTQPWLDDPALATINRSFHLSELLPQAVAAGVTRTVVVETDNIPGETEELLALADRAEPERSLAAVNLLHAKGFLTDARAIARSMPASPERDAYLSRARGR